MNIQNPKEVVVSPELEKEEDVLLYWTKERMDAAQPLPLPVLTKPIDNNTHVLTSPQGPPMSGDSRGPDEGESDEH